MEFEIKTEVKDNNHQKLNKSSESTSEDLNVSKETVKLSRVGRASAGKSKGDNVKSDDVEEPLKNKNGKDSKNVSSTDRDKKKKEQMSESEKEKLRKHEREESERILILDNDGFITNENIFKLFATGTKMKDKMKDSEVRDILLQLPEVKVTLDYIKLRDARRQKIYLQRKSNVTTYLEKVCERSKELSIKFDSFFGGNNLNDLEDIKTKIQWFTDEIMGDWTDNINLISLAQIYISKFLKEKIKNVTILNVNTNFMFMNSNLVCNESINFIAKVMLISSKDIQNEISSIKLQALENPDPIHNKKKKKIINGIYFQIILRFELVDYLSNYNPNECDINIHNIRNDLSLDILVHDTNELFDILITEGIEEKANHFLENVISNAYSESAILPKVCDAQGFPRPKFLRDVSSTKLPKRPSDEKIKRLKSNDSLLSTTTTTTNSSQILDNKLSFSSSIHKFNMNNSNVLQRHSSIPIRKPSVSTSLFSKNERKILVAQPRHLQTAGSSYSDKSSSSIMYRSVSNSKLPSPKKVCRNLFNCQPPKDLGRLAKMASSPLKKFSTLNTNIISPARTFQHYKLYPHSSPVGLKTNSANVFKSPESISLYRFKSRTPISNAKKITTPSPLKNSATFSKFEEPKRIINCKRKLELDTSASGIEEIEANRESTSNSIYNNKDNKMVELSPDITDFRSSSSRISIPLMKNSSAQKAIPFCNRFNDYYQEICPETPSNYFLKSPQLLGSIEKICDSPENVGSDEDLLLKLKQNQLLKKGISAASFYSGHSDNSKTWENSYAKLKSEEVRDNMIERRTLSTNS